MILLLVFWALVIAVTSFLTRPLLRAGKTGASNKQDLAIYREQLAEVDSDIARGLLTKAQAETVRTEIHRRMLATDIATKHGKPVSPLARKVYATLIIVLIPIFAFGLYITLGAPELPGRPYATRANDPDFLLDAAIRQTQAKLEKTPSKTGYKSLAEAFYMMKNYSAAASAYQKAIALGDNSASTWSEMGESVTLTNGGMASPEALDDFRHALKRDPKDARARFYIALGEAQKKNYKKAVGIWKGLQKDSSPAATWSGIVSKHIETYSKEGGFDAVSVQPAQP